MSDIVQVIERAIVARQIARGDCMCADVHGNMVAGGSCHDCVTAEPDIAQLRALRDRIEEDRKAKDDWRKAFRAERALLDICRGVGP